MGETTSNSNTRMPESVERKLKKKAFTISRLKRKILKHVWLVRIGIVASFFLGIYLALALFGIILSSFGVRNYIGLANDFIFTPQEKVKSTEGRTNIAILGKAGGEFAGADLTDTVIFVSLSHQNGDLVFISLPRDIWIPELRAKLNSAYYWGNQKQEKGGIKLAKSTIEEIIGQPVHYAVVGDFIAFREIIDALGGVDVEVESSFTDEKYPIAGREGDECEGDPIFACRYETVSFVKGLTHMDGELALKFVRSRNAEGDEGTDIAREARQQKVISAIIEKVLSPKTLLDFKKVLALRKIITDAIETDTGVEASAILTRKFLQTRRSMKSYLIPEEFLTNPPISRIYDDQYVFIPKNGDWKKVQEWVLELLNGD